MFPIITDYVLAITFELPLSLIEPRRACLTPLSLRKACLSKFRVPLIFLECVWAPFALRL